MCYAITFLSCQLFTLNPFYIFMFFITLSPRIRHGMGPNHLAADVRGVAAGCQGSGVWPVCHCQLVDGLYAHTCLHSHGRQVRPVCALPAFHGGVCPLFAVQCRVHPRDSQTLAGGNRKLFQDRTHVHHQAGNISTFTLKFLVFQMMKL